VKKNLPPKYLYFYYLIMKKLFLLLSVLLTVLLVNAQQTFVGEWMELQPQAGMEITLVPVASVDNATLNPFIAYTLLHFEVNGALQVSNWRWCAEGVPDGQATWTYDEQAAKITINFANELCSSAATVLEASDEKLVLRLGE